MVVPSSGIISTQELQTKLDLLKRRNISDAGLVLTAKNGGYCLGYIFEAELAYGLEKVCVDCKDVQLVRDYSDPMFIDSPGEDIGPLDDVADMTAFVDATPLTVRDTAPVEYAVELFGRLGIRCLVVVGGRGEVKGAVVKKRLVAWVEGVKEGREYTVGNGFHIA